MTPSIPPFVHLGARSDASLGESIATIDELCWVASRDQQPFLALTDVNSLANAPAFAAAAKHAGVRPIFGAELNVLPNGESQFRGTTFRARVLVENERGWQGAIRLVNLARAHETRARPAHVPLSSLWQDPRGLIILLGGERGELTHLAHERNYEKIEFILEGAIGAAGIDRIVIELSATLLADENVDALQTILAVAKYYGIAVAAVPLVRCAHVADEMVLRFFEGARTAEGMPPQTLSTLRDRDGSPCSFLTREKAAEQFAGQHEALAATGEIAQRCSSFELPMQDRQFPIHDFTRGVDADSFIWNTAFARATERYGDLPTRYKERLNREFGEITEAGLANAIVSLVRLDSELAAEGVQRGPGAGLLTNSVVASLLGLTRLDPLKFDLPFELTPGLSRGSFPLLQLSIPANQERGAENALRTLFDKQIMAVGEWKTWKTAQVVEWIGELLGRGAKWSTAMVRSDAFQRERERVATKPATYLPDDDRQMDSVEVVAWLAQRMEGRARELGVAQSVYTFSVDAIDSAIPARVIPGTKSESAIVVSEWSRGELGRRRFGCIEFLHAPLLNLIGEATSIVREEGEATYFPEQTSASDGPTYRLLSAGLTSGIEPLEAPSIRRRLRQGQPVDLHSMIRLLMENDGRKAEPRVDLSTILLCHVAGAIKAAKPHALYAASLSQAMGDARRTAGLMEEIRQRGITLLSVDVNYSGTRWSVERDSLRAGFNAVRMLNTAAAEEIISCRREMHFGSVTQFCQRIDRRRVKAHHIRALARAGAFDSVAASRQAAFQQLDEIFPPVANRRGVENDVMFFDREADWWSQDQRGEDGAVQETHCSDTGREQQREACGFVLRDDLTEEAEKFLRAARSLVADKFHPKMSLQVVTLQGIVSSVEVDSSVRGGMLADIDGCHVRASGPAAKVLASEEIIGRTVLCTGLATREAFQWSVDAEMVVTMDDAVSTARRATGLILDLSAVPDSALKPLLQLLKRFPGETPVAMRWVPAESSGLHQSMAERSVTICPLLQHGLDTLVGHGGWEVDYSERKSTDSRERLRILGRTLVLPPIPKFIARRFSSSDAVAKLRG